VDKLAFYASPCVPQVDKFARAVWHFSRLPRSITAAPATTYPTAQAPAPPASNLRIKEVRVAFELRNECLLAIHEPNMPRVQVVLVHRVVGIMRDRFWIGLDRSPEIRNVPIFVVDRLDAIEWKRPTQQNGHTSRKRFHKISNLAEPIPHEVNNG
jgi:hypothetical protein